MREPRMLLAGASLTLMAVLKAKKVADIESFTAGRDAKLQAKQDSEVRLETPHSLPHCPPPIYPLNLEIL